MTKLRFIVQSVAMLLLLATSNILHAEQETLKIGVAPHSSARFILKLYHPLRTSLEKSLGMKVEIMTAPDFTEYARRAVNQEYDIAITTGNQSRMLQTDAHYLPLLTYKAEFTAIAIVAKDSATFRAKDVDEKKVLGLSPTSLVTIWGLKWMRENGMGVEKVRYVSAADSVSQLLLAGDASVGFISFTNYKQLPVEVQKKLRIIARSRPLAGRVYMLNGRKAASEKKIKSALWTFSTSKEGKAYFSQNNLEGYRNLKPGELEAMEEYAEEVRKKLRASK